MFNTVATFLQENLSFLLNDPIVYVLLAICTILGAIWGKKGISKKRLSFKSISFPIIRENTNSISNVNILYKGEPIPNLTITNFVIWNSSDKSIRENDIVPKSQLHFFVNNFDAKILDISIIKTNNPSNNTQIIPLGEEFIFTFDYLNKKNGVVVQVIHTGQNDDIKFKGELIDGNLKCEDLSNIPFLKPFTKTQSSKATKIMDTILLIFISIYLFFCAIIFSAIIALKSFSILTILSLITLILIFFYYFTIYKSNFIVPRNLNSHLTLNK